MRIVVHVHGALQRHTQGADRLELDIPSGTTPAEVMAHLNIPTTEVFSVVVNGRMFPEDKPLQEEARVDLIPPIGGGL